jgi:hypothetical protein
MDNCTPRWLLASMPRPGGSAMLMIATKIGGRLHDLEVETS